MSRNCLEHEPICSLWVAIISPHLPAWRLNAKGAADPMPSGAAGRLFAEKTCMGMPAVDAPRTRRRSRPGIERMVE